MMGNTRLFFGKKPAFQTEAHTLLSDLQKNLHLPHLKSVVIYDGFDIYGINAEYLPALTWQVLGDPTSDELVDELINTNAHSSWQLSIEPLPGQFDQRADAAMQAAALFNEALRQTTITAFKTYVFEGSLSTAEQQKIKNYLLNPIDSRVKDLSKLKLNAVPAAASVNTLSAFTTLSPIDLMALTDSLNLSLTAADMLMIQTYFKDQQRDPTETEIRVLDTYWSDHCRHTTFLTAIRAVHFADDALSERLRASFDDYLACREQTGIGERPLTLMDLATINARVLRQAGKLDSVEISDEINACSVFIDVETAGESEKWLLQFKNETHNHPTEIEPFGGASTCLGGAIRDPLSGRAFVYQAVRVSGAANPLEPVEHTLTGKLPQRKITREAADGYSAYGNQIGVTTTQVTEIYHPGYRAKRMEVGAVVGAVPVKNVIRQKPSPGDKIILLGGKTGRDGCGGASGSSKAHTTESLTQSGAEVQKGNPPIERAIQRLFRNKNVTRKIKKCNDFGAGGVCVAIGELADSLRIDLDQIPTKYAGLSGTELTLSESQERMAVVVSPKDADAFIALCQSENTQAVVVAEVSDDDRMVITHQGQTIVDLQRDFIDSNGAKQYQKSINAAGLLSKLSPFKAVPNNDLPSQLQTLNNTSQRGLQDQFDSNIGAGTVLLPYGGKTQHSPAEASVQLLPKANTSTASAISHGFNPDIASYSPYLGGAYAVVEALTRQMAIGADINHIHLSFQEYFEKLNDHPDKWGKPFTALLGAFSACRAFGIAAIGGKDSMSGSFGDLHVPPTLIAFAISHLHAGEVISSELKSSTSHLYLLKHHSLPDESPNYRQLRDNYNWFGNHRQHIISAVSVKHSGAAVALSQAAFGNGIGFAIEGDDKDLFGIGYGSLIIETRQPLGDNRLLALGVTNASGKLTINGKNYAIDSALNAYQKTLETVFPLYQHSAQTSRPADAPIATLSFNAPTAPTKKTTVNLAQPRVFVPVFPGMNAEYDMVNAFAKNGAITHQQPFINLSPNLLKQSLDNFCSHLKSSQILALSGGFSAGDEPNGSGKYIAIVLKNQQVEAAIADFLACDGLIIGICNGFQALLKSGLLPYGKVVERQPDDITLAPNINHRHIARIAPTRICQNQSPWLADFSIGEVHDVAFSHGEGRLVASPKQLQQLLNKGQIATQYVDDHGLATFDPVYNPNGSDYAIEGLTSTCGKILGKMGHSERYAKHCYQNYPNFRPQNIFAAGVRYFG